MQLRPRQTIFVEACGQALAEHGNTLGVAPTGAGKTVMLSAIAGGAIAKGASGLVLQHRDELVSQNRDTFERVNPRASTGLYTAKRKQWGYDCTFAMVQTLVRNLDTMPPIDFMAIDEGHHAAADSYLQVIAKAKENNPEMKLLLVTATPNRGDKKALRGIVSNVADQISLKELIDARLLHRPRTMVVDIGVQSELANVRKTITDYDMAAVEAIMDKTVLNDQVVAAWREQGCDTRQTVVFCSTIQHAQHVAEAFRLAGVAAACVEGTMSAAERDAILTAYDKRELQVITNVAILTEGWDNQPTSCVILLRPSSYKSTMIQMIGRGLRIVDPERYPGLVKDDCIVLDFGTSILTHGSIEQDVDLDQKGIKECPECNAVLPAQSKECAICGYAFPAPEPVDDGEQPGGDGGEGGPKERSALTDFVMTEVDLFNSSPYRYETLFDGVVEIAAAMQAWAICIAYQGRWHAICGSEKTGIKHLADTNDRLIALAAADDFLREHGDREAAGKARRWLSEPPSQKQLELLKIPAMQSFGLTKYRATCLLQWKFSERAVRNIVTQSQRQAA